MYVLCINPWLFNYGPGHKQKISHSIMRLLPYLNLLKYFGYKEKKFTVPFSSKDLKCFRYLEISFNNI